MRESTSRRAAIDIDEFERRLRAPVRERPPASDPLSELARLMHGDEAAAPARDLDRLFSVENPDRGPQLHDAPAAEDEFAAELRGAFDEAHAAAYAAPPAVHEAPVADGRAEFYGARETAPAAAAGYAAPGGRDEDAAFPDYDEEELAATAHWAPTPKTGRLGALSGWLRPWRYYVVALSVAGLAIISYVIAHRSGAIGSREIVTIAAPEGPVKVAPPAVEAQADSDQTESAVLDRQEAAPVKRVVSRQEEPVEPTVAPEAQQPVFSPPKRVKTVSVRPDGTVIDNPPPPPAVARASAPEAAEAAPKRPVATTTPKAAVKPVTTPKPEKPAQAARPRPPAPKVAATEPAQSAPPETQETATTPGKGGFAVQFGAAGSEAEAHALVTKVATKYASQLGGLRPTFQFAKVGDKTVYRVRVHGISKEAAVKVCEKVKTGGGSCFVAGAN